MYVCMCLCTYVRTYLHTHTHINSYIHTYIHRVFPTLVSTRWINHHSDNTNWIYATETELISNLINSTKCCVEANHHSKYLGQYTAHLHIYMCSYIHTVYTHTYIQYICKYALTYVPKYVHAYIHTNKRWYVRIYVCM